MSRFGGRQRLFQFHGSDSKHGSELLTSMRFHPWRRRGNESMAYRERDNEE